MSEIIFGGRLEKRFVNEVECDRAQGMWLYLVWEVEAGAEERGELGWIGLGGIR